MICLLMCFLHVQFSRDILRWIFQKQKSSMDKTNSMIIQNIWIGVWSQCRDRIYPWHWLFIYKSRLQTLLAHIVQTKDCLIVLRTLDSSILLRGMVILKAKTNEYFSSSVYMQLLGKLIVPHLWMLSNAPNIGLYRLTYLKLENIIYCIEINIVLCDKA